MQPEPRTAFAGKLVHVVIETERTPDGRSYQREVVLHPGAVAVVARPTADSILLIKQYRHVVGDTIYELPAGTLEAGESPEVCAARELEEETGYRARRLVRLTTFYTSPGFVREVMHLFEATGLEHVGSRPEADERIEVCQVSRQEALSMVRDGRIVDAKTLVGILWLAAQKRGDG